VVTGGRHHDDEAGDESCKNGSIGKGHEHNSLKIDVGEDEDEEDEEQVGIDSE